MNGPATVIPRVSNIQIVRALMDPATPLRSAQDDRKTSVPW